MGLYRKNYVRIAMPVSFVADWQQKLEESGCEVVILRPSPAVHEVIAEQFKGYFPFECEEDWRILNQFTFALISPASSSELGCVFFVHDSRVVEYRKARMEAEETLFIMWSRSARPAREETAFVKYLVATLESNGGRRLRPWYVPAFLHRNFVT